MRYNPLGQSGVLVSELCFGTMSFGKEADAAEAKKMFNATRDAGINFYDCADTYSLGEAEKILGHLVKGQRQELVLTSKCGMSMGDSMGDRINNGGTSRRHIKLSVEQSLKRLQTDYLDILFMHRWDELTPLDETLRGLEDLVRDGKVLYAGASNYAAWQIAKALGVSAAKNQVRFEVIQPMYNLVKRQAEVEILPLAKSEGLAVVSYGPVGGGLLSGKYGPGLAPATGRLVDVENYRQRYDQSWVYETAGKFTEFAESAGYHPVSLAVAWVNHHEAITSPIIGARNVEQLERSLDAINIEMEEDLYNAISALSIDPPLATDRLDDQIK